MLSGRICGRRDSRRAWSDGWASSTVLIAPRLKVEARQIDTGQVAINRASHEPLAPFGGFKKSGISREFGSFGQDSGNLGGLP